MRTASRADGNAKAIVAALEASGVSVIDLRYPTDLLCGLAGVTFLVELKNLSTPYGRKGLNKNQHSFCETWRGGNVWVLTGAHDVPALLLAIRHDARRLKAQRAA